MLQSTSITLTYDGHDKDVLQLDWSEIKKYSISRMAITNGETMYCTSCKDSAERHYDLARFIRQIGESTNAQYGEDSTGAYFEDVVDWLKAKFPNKLYAEYTGCNVLSWLGKGGIAMMYGERKTDTNPNIAHAWVADGYQKIGYDIYNYIYDGDAGGYVLESKESTVKEYIHYNWGFSGDSNGFFLKDIFDPSEGESYDYYSYTKNRDYKYNVKYFAIYQSDNE
jgi:hypothetical protein